jgi:cyclic pyranopterin phosphate synthase
MNEDEIADFANLTEQKPFHVRFIELMPMGGTGFFSKERWVPLEEILERASPLEPLPSERWPTGHGPARYYRRPGAQGTAGFIGALSCRFCSSCNRIRLSASGILFPCLDGKEGADLLTPLRNGAGRGEIKELILDAVRSKPEGHFMLEACSANSANPRFMCQIGG